MDELSIVLYPHPILRHKSKPITKIDNELKETVRRMFEVMYEAEGVGLAANQVGLPYQFFVMNVSGDPEKPEDEHVFINPIIQKKKNREELEEGCLSFPEINAPVVRPAEIEFEAIDLEGKPVQYQWSGMLARAAQHEIDHLNGISFVDRISETAFAEIREELQMLQTQFETDQRLGIVPSNDELHAKIAELEKKW